MARETKRLEREALATVRKNSLRDDEILTHHARAVTRSLGGRVITSAALLYDTRHDFF